MRIAFLLLYNYVNVMAVARGTRASLNWGERSILPFHTRMQSIF